VKFDETKTIVFDPADACDAIIDWLKSHQCKLSAIFLTHEHPDHCSGVDQLYNEFESPIYSSVPCENNIRDPKLNYSLYSSEIANLAVKSPVKILDGYGVVSIEGCAVNFMASPGHSTGSMVFNIADDWFTGDTILEGKTALGLPHSSLADYKNSILQFLDKIEQNDKIHPGHGESFQFISEQSLLASICAGSKKLLQLFEVKD
jgi:hydroxyacylglutathione hydrolase